MVSVSETSDVLALKISVDEDCDELKLDVCPDAVDEIWNDVVEVDVTVEVLLVLEDGLELVEESRLVELQVLEVGQWYALGSSLPKIALWIRQYPSFVASSPQG